MVNELAIVSELKSIDNYKGAELPKVHYVETIIKKGKSEWKILDFGSGYYDVYKSVNGKRSAIASPMGKVFHSWDEMVNHYKSISHELGTIVKQSHMYEVPALMGHKELSKV